GRAGRPQPLAARGRADIDGVKSIRLEHDARALLRSGRAALDEAADCEAVVAPVDQLAGELRLLRPLDLVEAAIERGVVVAAVEFVLALERRDGAHLIPPFPLPPQIPPPALHP